MTENKARILVVEDDAESTNALIHILEHEGYKVDTACNGKVALDYLLANDPPSLILLDMAMPVMDGNRFRKAQLEHPKIAKIPVVVFSGIDWGASDETIIHLRKPFDLDMLLEAIGRITRRLAPA